jgi:alkanesulfonate monooxygenase
MGVEFIGMIGTRPGSETSGPSVSILSGHVDIEYVRDFTRAHERSGFDRVLIGYGSTGPDALSVAGYCASVTERIGFLIAHRPGFVAPTLAARKFATLDQFTQGRIAVHIITGGSDLDEQRDGDWLDHDGRYRRTDEYLEVVRRVWTSEEPFDHEGEFYRVSGAHSDVKPLQKPYPPIYFGGASGPAVTVGARHCDVYALWGEPLAAIRERIAMVRAAANAFGRQPRFSLSVRPILGATESEAWDRAHRILSRIREVGGVGALGASTPSRPQAVGSMRLLKFAQENEVYDKRLWMPIAAATGAAGNTTALVGTPEQVAESLLDYCHAGVTTLLIRGFEPYKDAIDYGRALIPMVRAEVERRDQAVAAKQTA